MEYIRGWVFATEADAQYYCDICTEYYSPLPDGWVWTQYVIDKSNGVKVIYIIWDESIDAILVPLLGDPIEIQIDESLTIGR